jgi:transposase
MIIGVDFGEWKHSICIVGDDGRKLEECEVEHSGAQLVGLCARLQRGAHGEPVRVGIERPNGALVELFKGFGFSVFAINPKQIDHWRQFESGSSAKDDRRDAYAIADALRRKPEAFQRLHESGPEVEAMRLALSTRSDLVQQRTAALNRLQAVGRPLMPCAMRLMDPRTKWARRVLRQLVQLKRPELVRLATLKAAMRGTRAVTPEDMLSALRADRALFAAGRWASSADTVQVFLEQIELFDRQLERVELTLGAALDAFARNAGETAQQDIEIIRSMPGVGQQLAAVLAVYGWTAVQQRDRERIRRLGGLAPVTSQTGGRRRPQNAEVRQRRACNHLLREALHHWGRVAAQCDPKAKARLAELRARGHTFGRAIRQLADGLLRVMFAAIKEGQPYRSAQEAA